MQKVKSNAHWAGLSPEQRQTLDKWFFEEKLGYAAVLPKAQAELGFKGQMTSLKRYFLRRRKERVMEEFTDLRDEMAAISGAPVDVESLRLASMKLLGRFLFRQMQQSPEKVKEWAAVAGLMLQNDHNEVLREGQKIKEGWLKFAKEKFQFDTMEEALKALPELMQLQEAKKDPHTKRYAENAYWNRMRRRMFGPGIEIHPETAEEEAAMLAAKKERDERRAREAQMEREKINDAQPPPPMSQYYQEYVDKQLEGWEPDYEI